MRPASLVFVVCAASGLQGTACEKESDAERPAQRHFSKRPDPHADGRALATEQAAWKTAWSQVRDLPSCEKLPIQEAEKALCDRARASRAALRRLEDSDASESRVLDAAEKLADDGMRAWNALRPHGLRWMIEGMESRRARDAGTRSRPGDVRDVPARPPGIGSARGHSGHSHAGAEPADPNPWAEPVKSYLGAASMGVSRLTGFLRLGPLETRRSTLARFERLVAAHRNSRLLRSALSDAWFSENDEELKKRIGALRDRTRPEKKK